jgi:hypothetical protein
MLVGCHRHILQNREDTIYVMFYRDLTLQRNKRSFDTMYVYDVIVVISRAL